MAAEVVSVWLVHSKVLFRVVKSTQSSERIRDEGKSWGRKGMIKHFSSCIIVNVESNVSGNYPVLGTESHQKSRDAVGLLCPFCKIKTLEGFHQLKNHSHWYLLSQHQFIMQLTTSMPWRFLFTCVPVVVAGGPWQLGTKGEHQVEQSPGKKNDVGHTGVQEDHLPTIADTCRVRYGTFSFRQTSLNLLYLCLIHDLSCLLFP